MPHHTCFAVPDQNLDIVIVDDSKTMQGILRSVLSALKVKRIRTFDSAEDAFHAMLSDRPNLIISEWNIGNTTGQQFLRMLRARFMDPLCFVPVIVVTSVATTSMLEKAMLAGAHLVMVKPISTTALASRINWLRHDEREFILGPRGSYEIAGVRDRVKSQIDRSRALRRAVAYRAEDPNPAQGANVAETVAAASERQIERWRAFLKAREAATANAKASAARPMDSILRNRARAASGFIQGN